MSTDLTVLEPTLFSTAQEVAAEPFGIVSAIRSDFDNKGVAVGDEVTVPFAPTRSASDFTPAATPPAGDGATAGDIKVRLTKSRKVSWVLTGEQIRTLENGQNFDRWVGPLIAEGMRTLRNEAEVDCAIAVKQGISRAIDSTGADPFASNINMLAQVRKILRDNGSPMADAQCVFDTSVGVSLRELNIIQQADQAGTAEERRTGNLLRQFGFALTESAGIEAHTPGDATGRLVNGAVADGVTSIAFDTGSGSFNAGDLVTISSNVYGVAADTAATPLTINRPGARGAIADNASIAEVGAYTPILAFERSAVVGIMRPPLIPSNPTQTPILIEDQFGMTYLLLAIAQYGQISWELHLAWGFKAVNTHQIAAIAAP